MCFLGCSCYYSPSLRSVVLNKLHEVHTGVVRMKSLAPNLDHDIEQVVKECNVCQQHAHLSAIYTYMGVA